MAYGVRGGDVPGVGKFVCSAHEEAVVVELVCSAIAYTQQDCTVVGEREHDGGSEGKAHFAGGVEFYVSAYRDEVGDGEGHVESDAQHDAIVSFFIWVGQFA